MYALNTYQIIIIIIIIVIVVIMLITLTINNNNLNFYYYYYYYYYYKSQACNAQQFKVWGTMWGIGKTSKHIIHVELGNAEYNHENGCMKLQLNRQ